MSKYITNTSVLLAIFTLALTGCSSDDREIVTITGASTMAPVVADIAKRFEKNNPDVRVDVHTGGSSRGINDVASGLANIGMSSRDLTTAEKKDKEIYVLAQDGVCFSIHKNNPISNLTDDQLLGIYAGEITNWMEAGGDDSPITVINRANGRSERELVAKRFGIKAGTSKTEVIAGETMQCIKMVSGDPAAIAYLSLGIAQHEAGQGRPIKLLPLAGVAASVEEVEAGNYTFSRPLLFVVRRQPTPATARFIEFALSTNVHDLIRRYAFVPVKQR